MEKPPCAVITKSCNGLKKEDLSWGRETCRYAAFGGQIGILERLRQRNPSWIDEKVGHSAALGGHILVLEWAGARDVPISSGIGALAAREGHIHVLQWLQANFSIWSAREVCTEAAANGHLHLLQWWRATGRPFNLSIKRYPRCLGETKRPGHYPRAEPAFKES